jgi:hypothetical protein
MVIINGLKYSIVNTDSLFQGWLNCGEKFMTLTHILYEYIHNAKSPEEIAQNFQTVTLAQVYATILYYLENRGTVGQYLADWLDYTMKSEAEHDRHPPRIVEQLRALRANQAEQQVPA